LRFEMGLGATSSEAERLEVKVVVIRELLPSLPSLYTVRNSENVLETGLNYDVTNATRLTKQAMET